MIYARASPLAAKFCTKTKKTPCPLAVLIVENKCNERKMEEMVMVFDNKNVFLLVFYNTTFFPLLLKRKVVATKTKDRQAVKTFSAI